MIDRDDAGAAVGRDLLLNADVMFENWGRVRDGTLTRDGFRRTYEWLRDESAAALVRGTTCDARKTAGVCRDLLKVKGALWTFPRRDGIEPTNNAAERASATPSAWRKTSYGTDSEPGSRFVERILTLVATARQRGHAVLATLTDAICDARKGGRNTLPMASGV